MGSGIDGSGCCCGCGCGMAHAEPSSVCAVLYVMPSSYPHSSSPPYSGDASDSGDITIAACRPSADDEVTSDELSSSIRSGKPPLLDQRRLMSKRASHAPGPSTDGHPTILQHFTFASRDAPQLYYNNIHQSGVETETNRFSPDTGFTPIRFQISFSSGNPSRTLNCHRVLFTIYAVIFRIRNELARTFDEK